MIADKLSLTGTTLLHITSSSKSKIRKLIAGKVVSSSIVRLESCMMSGELFGAFGASTGVGVGAAGSELMVSVANSGSSSSSGGAARKHAPRSRTNISAQTILRRD